MTDVGSVQHIAENRTRRTLSELDDVRELGARIGSVVEALETLVTCQRRVEDARSLDALGDALDARDEAVHHLLRVLRS